MPEPKQNNLPVVSSVIWHLTHQADVSLVLATSVHGKLHDPHPTDLEAVTVPWALLEDAAFRHAVRLRALDTDWVGDGRAYTDRWFYALAAELRARAGGPEADCGKPQDGAV